jgi:peptide deformylase
MISAQAQQNLAKREKIHPIKNFARSTPHRCSMSQTELLPILHYPDPRLHTVAKPIAQVDDRVRAIIPKMLATMYDANGIGLAATQVNIHERLIVIDVSEEHNQPMVLINPQVEWASPEKRKGDEGCLSVPGIYDGVERSVAVKVRAQDEHGNSLVIEAEGLLAVFIQHEMDHLMGKVFVEYLSPLKRTRIKTKLLKAEREAVR